MLEGTPLGRIQRAADLLSRRYRNEVRDGRLHLSDELAAKAYLATRLPATYAAIRASLAAFEELRPDFQPRSLLDIGSGPGSVLWAVRDQWPSLEEAVMVEASAAIRQIGEQLAEHAVSVRAAWIEGDLAAGLPMLEKSELVTLSYVLDELVPQARDTLIDRLWSLTGDTLLIVEPGTPAGWRRILGARKRLIAAGAHIIAPCPHQEVCPLAAPDWCHFSRRVARTRVHRLAKSGEVPWEDEKFIYLAASRQPARAFSGRVLAPPRTASGAIRFKLCRNTGAMEESLVTRRHGAAFKTARRLDWGDAVMEELD